MQLTRKQKLTEFQKRAFKLHASNFNDRKCAELLGVSEKQFRKSLEIAWSKEDALEALMWWGDEVKKDYLVFLLKSSLPETPEQLAQIMSTPYFDGSAMADHDFIYLCGLAGMSRQHADLCLSQKKDRLAKASNLRGLGYIVQTPRNWSRDGQR